MHLAQVTRRDKGLPDYSLGHFNTIRTGLTSKHGCHDSPDAVIGNGVAHDELRCALGTRLMSAPARVHQLTQQAGLRSSEQQ